MKTLYVDNYKGFNDIFIPLENVNFLVGENSTGKTSILNLISLLSSFEFWSVADFNSDENVIFGHFSEIVNRNAIDKTYFSIGIEFGHIERREKGSMFILMRFEEKKGIPYISEYRETIKQKDVHVIISDKIKYGYTSYKEQNFESWIKSKVEGIEYEESPIKYKGTFGAIRCMIRTMIDIKNDINLLSGAIMVSPLFKNINSYAPIRIKPKRIYESFYQHFSADGKHLFAVLNNILSEKEENENLLKWINSYGVESNLFDSIGIEKLGENRDAPFAIHVSYGNLSVNITNVGYGVSQALPLIVEILRSKNKTISIQQPEVHLHPKAQAAFGELVYHSVRENQNNFFIETHSDYIINRFRYNQFKNKSDEPKWFAQVLFFERNNSSVRVTPLKIDSQGKFIDEFPDSYSNFFIDEELKMLEF